MLTKKLYDQAMKNKAAQRELHDITTGEVFQPRSRNHYEENDGVPVAPPVEMRRPTIRERVENLIRRGADPLGPYVGTEGIDMDVPEDGDAPLTPSEQNYIDMIAEDLAERAPLPDEGLPRPEATAPPAEVPPAPAASAAAPAGVSSPPLAPPASTVPSR